MAVPKRRTTRAKRDQRRANHDKVTAPNVAPCSNCGEMTRPHRICGSCGQYKGRAVIAMEAAVEAAPTEAAPTTEASEG